MGIITACDIFFAGACQVHLDLDLQSSLNLMLAYFYDKIDFRFHFHLVDSLQDLNSNSMFLPIENNI